MQKQPSLPLGGHLYQKQPSVSRKKSRMPPLTYVERLMGF
jgi:hypothetical protein